LQMMRQFLSRPKHLGEMSFDDKRKLLQHAFSGKDAEGKRCGVYVSRTAEDRWVYTIKGVFNDRGIMRKIDHIGIAKKPSNQAECLDKDKKQDGLGQCHAYNSQCFH